jgi:hypothetical protein
MEHMLQTSGWAKNGALHFQLSDFRSTQTISKKKVLSDIKLYIILLTNNEEIHED